MDYLTHLFSYLTVGNFVIIDLIAATTNALNGALLAQRPDYYRGKQWTIVGILILGIFGGIGGGSAHDIIAGKLPPGSWTNPLYLILCILAGIVGLLTAYGKGQNFRETWFQFMTAFSLPWYAAMGVARGAPGRDAAHRCRRPGRGRPDHRPLPDRRHGRQVGQAVRPRRVVCRHGRADFGGLPHLRSLSAAEYLAGYADFLCRRLHLPRGGDSGSPGKSRCRATYRRMSSARSSAARRSRRRCSRAGKNRASRRPGLEHEYSS